MAWTGKRWSDELVQKELLDCIGDLRIDRMPTSGELKSLGRLDLHMAVQKSRKYSGWASHLNLERKQSETVRGQQREDEIRKTLESKGHEVKSMTTKHPYDLLVDGTVKIDVKTGKAWSLRGSRVHSFGINKVDQSCDIYIVVALDEFDNAEKTFVIPSHYLKVSTMCIGKQSKYDRFRDRWDYIDQYKHFYGSIL